MPERVAQQISLFCSQLEKRRFDDGTLKILESVSVCKDLTSLLEVRAGLREFTRDECLRVLHEIADKSVERKLSILDFFVRAFDHIGDVEACENALLCFQMNGMDPGTYDFSDVQIINKIKKFKDFTTELAASQSVQAQAADYLEKKTVEKSTKHSVVCKETVCLASTLFRNGIKRHNIRKLQEHQTMQQITSAPDAPQY